MEEDQNEEAIDSPDACYLDFDSLIPEEDIIYNARSSTYKDSPFYKAFIQTEENFELEVDENAKENPYYVPKIIKYLTRYLLPFYPFWSRYNQCQIIPNATNPLTNSATELRIEQAKNKTMKRRKHVKAHRYIREILKDSEKRILEYSYDANFKRINYKRKRDTDREESAEIKAKKPHQEIWVRQPKSSRPPGGIYSKEGASNYANKMVKRALSLSKPQKVRSLESLIHQII